ncbi:MAG: hypothetical protein K6F86_10030, partial [Lachnospiraceae bacterium]|nr:hypothetical protein [Lachnospiraceae bacterium]
RIKAEARKEYIIIAGIILIGLVVLLNLAVRLSNSDHYSFDLTRFEKNGFTVENGCLILDHSEVEEDRLNSSRFCLRQGECFFNFDYQTESDYQATIYLDNDLMGTIQLPAGQDHISQSFSLEWPTDRAYISFEMPSSGRVTISSITISSDRLLYTDAIFQIAALLFVCCLLIWLVHKTVRKDREQQLVIISLAAMILLANIPLYINLHFDNGTLESAHRVLDGVTRFGTDTGAQLMRLQGVMYGLLDGQHPVLIAPNYLRENGELQFMYPNIFLYPFSLLRLAGCSMPMVFRWFSVICNTATIMSMYYSCRLLSDKRKLCLMITALYTFEPHRLRVVLTKGAAMGMGVPYIFIPLAVAGLFLIIKKQNKGIWLLAFGVSGTLESHITSVLLLMGLLVFAAFSCIKELCEDGLKGLKMVVSSVIVCLLMNLGFLVIFTYYYMIGINTDALGWTSLSSNTLTPLQMITDAESLFYFVGIIVTVIMLFLYKDRSTTFRFALLITVFSAILWIMTSDLFPYETISEVFGPMKAFASYMQKPHRFYTVMAGGLLLALLLLTEHVTQKTVWRVAIATWSLVVFSTTIVEYRRYMDVGWRFYDELYGDINIVMTGDYLPEGVDSEAEFSGTGSLSDEDHVESLYYKKLGTTVDYHYVAESDGIYAEFPLLTYDGYVAVDETGSTVPVSKGRDARLTVYLKGDGQEHGIHIEFVVKPIFRLLYLFSLTISVLSLLYYIYSFEVIKCRLNKHNE